MTYNISICTQMIYDFYIDLNAKAHHAIRSRKISNTINYGWTRLKQNKSKSVSIHETTNDTKQNPVSSAKINVSAKPALNGGCLQFVARHYARIDIKKWVSVSCNSLCYIVILIKRLFKHVE